MNDPFKSENYKKNLDSLIKAIKLGNVEEIEKQYNKAVGELSQALKGLTDKAKGVAEFVICSDLNNYIEPVNKKPSGLFGTLKGIWYRTLGKDVPIENKISNFAKGKLPSLVEKITFEYLNVLKKISDGVNLANRTASEQKEDTFKPPKEKSGSNRMGQIKRPTTAPPLPPGSKETSSSEKASPSIELQKEEQPKRKSGGNRTKKIKRPTTAPPPPPDSKKVRFESNPGDSGYGSSSDEEHEYKTSKAPVPVPVPKETLPTDQEVKQEPKKGKPIVPQKSENQYHKQSAQEATNQKEERQIKKPESPLIKKRMKNFEPGSSTLRIKSANVINKAPPVTQVSVKEIAAQFEKGKEK